MNNSTRLLTTLAAALLLGFYGWQNKDGYVDQFRPLTKAIQNAGERVSFAQLFSHHGASVTKSEHSDSGASTVDVDFWVKELTMAANTIPTPFSPYQMIYFSVQGPANQEAVYLILKTPKSQANTVAQGEVGREIPAAGDIARNWICHTIESRQIANGSVPNVLLEVQDPFGGVKTQELIVTSHCG